MVEITYGRVPDPLSNRYRLRTWDEMRGASVVGCLQSPWLGHASSEYGPTGGSSRIQEQISAASNVSLACFVARSIRVRARRLADDVVT